MRYSIDNFVKNTALETENVSLKTDRDNLLAKVKELETKVSDADKTVSAFPLAKQDWEKELNNLKTEQEKILTAIKAEYEAKIAGLTTDLEATKKSVNKEVVANLTAVGIQAGTVKEEAVTKVTTPSRFKLIDRLQNQ